MALSQIYTAIAGDTITALRWNNEFGNIYNNGTDVGFPLTKAVSFAGWTVTLDALGATTISSTSSTGFLFSAGSKAGQPSANGSICTFAAQTFQNNYDIANATQALQTFISIRTPTLTGYNSGLITTEATTLYIEGPPTQGSNQTITNPYAIHVEDGNVLFDGDLKVVGTLSAPVTQNSQSAAYPLVLTDAGKHILHPSSDNNPRTFTIPANASIAYPTGTVITFVNQINVLTIAITSDTMTLAGTTSTGSRTLAVNGIATALKVSSTGWLISGTGLA